MPSYKVKSPVRKDGTDFAPGETIDLSVKEAKEMGPDVVERVELGKESTSNGNGSDISKMTKAQLIEFAAAKFNLTLDVTQSKDELIAAVAKAAGEQK
jgi:hypothetical protein